MTGFFQLWLWSQLFLHSCITTKNQLQLVTTSQSYRTLGFPEPKRKATDYSASDHGGRSNMISHSNSHIDKDFYCSPPAKSLEGQHFPRPSMRISQMRD